MASQSGLIGVAGEHFAAAELARRGFLVTLTRGNAPGIDILAYWPPTRRTIRCQVKATDGRKHREDGRWMMTQKEEDVTALRSQFFILVYIPGDDTAPHYSIAPSHAVAKQIFEQHRRWEKEPSKKGQPHSKTNPIRMFFDKQGNWRDKWNLIEEAAATTPPPED
jgi:hypothetical protein